ncbi:hypothetical protein A2W24_04205 [Microgenomates group bacterium RBG_16_45_19]|nr:MAG: hypothetical protein A2W24_04205 [Microgenomates group bacterium RBG_16_45_19]
MLTDLRTHSTHYALLAGWLALSMILFLMVQGQTQAEVVVAVMTAGGYLVWGLVHHYLLGDLHAKIVAEYALAAAVAIMILTAAVTNR